MGLVFTQLVFHKRKIEDALFNVGIVTTSTLMGGLVFALLGGSWDMPDNSTFLPLTGMIFTIVAVNHVILGRYYFMIDEKFTFKQLIHDLTWDLTTYLITVPLGFLMAFLYFQVGITGIMLIFVPLATSSYVFRIYKKVEQFNNQLNGLYEITTEINSNLNFNETLENIGDHCVNLLSLDSFYILLVENIDELKSAYSKGEMVDYLGKTNLKFGQGASGVCAQTRKTVLIGDTNEDKRVFSISKEGNSCSLIAVPLLRQDQLIGVMTGVKRGKNAYENNEIKLFEIMANQAAVAIDNAKAFKEVENMAIMDELTKVYNYRYFQQRVHQEVENAALEGGHVSLMVIDLDDFKGVNDKYGHTTGNRVLIDLAQVLRKSIRKYDVLFRYGGDEFVVIFPSTQKNLAYTIGQRILENVSNHPFNCEGVQEYLTFSAGIAEYPTDADDHLDLMRKADRIMYVGAKERGKNRVTLYNTK